VNIQKEIQQKKPFNSNYQKVIINLFFSNNWLGYRQKVFFQPYGLTLKQYNILRILRGAGEPLSTCNIRERMLDKMSDASRIVDRLEKKNLITKNQCKWDQRKIDVTITDSALELLSKIDFSLSEWQKNVTNLTEKEAGQLSDLLDKMRK